MPKLEDFRNKLSIDVDDLEECLATQAELFSAVAEEFVRRAAERDAIKLDLETATAELDKQLRLAAEEHDEKITEVSMKQKLRRTPKINSLTKDYYSASAEADSWEAMRDSFKQRSFMLRELVGLKIAEMYNLGLERGSAGARSSLLESRSRRASQLREHNSSRD